VITYRATLDVPVELLRFVTRLLITERRLRGTPGREPGADLPRAGDPGPAAIP
jgi:hypothetical protein